MSVFVLDVAEPFLFLLMARGGYFKQIRRLAKAGQRLPPSLRD
jgi:hypothetical protein